MVRPFGSAFLLCPGVSGCVNSSLPQYSWKAEDLKVQPGFDRTPPSVVLSAEQVRKDISYLKYALLNGYGGRNHIRDGKFERGVDALDRITGPAMPLEFKNRIDNVLLEIPDNHLVARLSGSPSPERLKAEKNGLVGRNAISNAQKIWEVDIKSTSAGKEYLFVSITKFIYHKDVVWTGFLEDVKRSLSHVDFLVLDLRGNTGGGDTKGMELAELLNGGPTGHPVVKQYTSRTPETLAISGNYYRLKSYESSKEGKVLPSYFFELLSEKEENYGKALRGELPKEEISVLKGKGHPFSLERGFAKPIYILMDGESASASESTIHSFEWHPYVKRVGENTAGCLHFGNIGFFWLPESKVKVQMASHYNEFFDGRFLEGTGIAPDIRVPSGTDALTYLLENQVAK